jgi:UDP-N-acetylglucosamine 2-epimerase (non-hydrolysing)
MDQSSRSNGSTDGWAPGTALLPSGLPIPELHLIGGTRAEAVKMAPVVEAIRGRGRMGCLVVATGEQEAVFDQTLEVFGIRPDVRLPAEPRGGRPELLAALMRQLDEHFARRRPAAVVVQGDTTTALAGALAAFWRGITVIHLEAGLRTHDLRTPFPEEANRRLIARISSLHLTPTPAAAANLHAEGITGSGVLMVGNTVVDAVTRVAGRPVTYHDPRLAAVEWRARSGQSRLLVATVRRVESWGAPLSRIMDALRTLLQRHTDVEIVLPIHPSDVVRKQLMTGLFGTERVHFTAPLPYDEFCRLLATARLVLSDSAGVQEEAPTFGVPVLVLRDLTERMEALETGDSWLVGSDPQGIVDLASRLLDDPTEHLTGATNPFGDGHAAPRVEHAIAWLLGMEHRPPAAPSTVNVKYTPSERVWVQPAVRT